MMSSDVSPEERMDDFAGRSTKSIAADIASHPRTQFDGQPDPPCREDALSLPSELTEMTFGEIDPSLRIDDPDGHGLQWFTERPSADDGDAINFLFEDAIRGKTVDEADAFLSSVLLRCQLPSSDVSAAAVHRLSATTDHGTTTTFSQPSTLGAGRHPELRKHPAPEERKKSEEKHDEIPRGLLKYCAVGVRKGSSETRSELPPKHFSLLRRYEFGETGGQPAPKRRAVDGRIGVNRLTILNLSELPY